MDGTDACRGGVRIHRLLKFKSPLPECGKTRLLEVEEALVRRPWLTGRVTAAVLMRKVDAEHPVVLLDESDAAFKGDKNTPRRCAPS